MIKLNAEDIADLLGIFERTEANLVRSSCESCPCDACARRAKARRELEADIAEARAWIAAQEPA